MHIPPTLRSAIDITIAGRKMGALRKDFQALSQAYARGRGESPFVDSHEKVLAYIATRMPSIYVVLHAIFMEIHHRCPSFSPSALIDAGAGPGTVIWAASAVWEGLSAARLIDNNVSFQAIGKTLLQAGEHPLRHAISWEHRNLQDPSASITGAAPLVTASYVLGELSTTARHQAVLHLWEATEDFLVLVEPGTPDGFERILMARSLLLDHGAFLFAPCAGSGACPMPVGRWCHFARRVERTSAQRSGKGAALGFEDEKYCFLVASRTPASAIVGRVIASPTILKHQATMHLCDQTNSLVFVSAPKNDRSLYRTIAKDLRWGDSVALGVIP